MKGEFVTRVSSPLLFKLKAETFFDPLFATYTNSPEGVTVTEAGVVPVVNGEFVTGVSTPLELLMLNAETLLDPLLAT